MSELCRLFIGRFKVPAEPVYAKLPDPVKGISLQITVHDTAGSRQWVLVGCSVAQRV